MLLEETTSVVFFNYSLFYTSIPTRYAELWIFLSHQTYYTFASLRSASFPLASRLYFFHFEERACLFYICANFHRYQAVNLSQKSEKPCFDGLSGFLQLGVVFETSNIAHVTPWVHFCRNQSVNLRNTVSEVRKTLFFDGLSGFLQLGVVLETSNIAHVTPRVHTFLGKKEFFKSVENFFLFGYTNTHTYKHTKSDQHKYYYRCYLSRPIIS